MTIDTNILVGYLDGDRNIVTKLQEWQSDGVTLFLPTIVESELLSYRALTQTQKTFLDYFLNEGFVSIAFDRSIARIAARIRQETKAKLPDAGIAATAFFTHTPVVTRNIKDFQRFIGLQIVKI